LSTGVDVKCETEDEESRLLERVRNLSIMPSDDERMVLTAKEAKEFNDD
jgi:hypothetical protein